MRVPQPGLLKLNKEDLLADLRVRLSERYPDYANESDFDATDPAWILLEQSAWLTELLSEQLDRYPYAMVQEFVHLMGGQLQPATPAIGVVTVEPDAPGVLSFSPERPSVWRLFTLQTEDQDMVEFAFAEPEVHIRPATILSMTEYRSDELYISAQPSIDGGLASQEVWKGRAKKSSVFNQEWVRYDLISANADDLVETIESAIESLETRNIGWLELRVEKQVNDMVSLFARVNLGKAFSKEFPTGFTAGDDARANWGTLDDSIWTPPVRITETPKFSPVIRGRPPQPGIRRGTIVVPRPPENTSIDELLVRDSAPLPVSVVNAIWTTLTHQDQKLASYSPMIFRGVEDVEDPSEPTWISASIQTGIWSDLIDRSKQTFIHVDIEHFQAENGKFRLAFILKGVSEEQLPELRVYGFERNDGLQRIPLTHNMAWKLRLPDPMGGQRMVLAVAYDVDVMADHTQLLFATSASPLSVLLNAAMIINAPAVNDGREVVIERNIPESVNLLFDDIVNLDVMAHLTSENLSQDVKGLLKSFPLAHFEVSDGQPIKDFHGIWFDPTSTADEGALMRLNAPDNTGHQRRLRPNDTIELNWYRRTEGDRGNVPSGLVEVIEQPPNTSPLLLSARNPLATFYGSDREHEHEAIQRMFTPASSVPVTSADWEREFRVAMGVKGRGWMVRCWSHSERSMLSTALWPLSDDPFAIDVVNASLRNQLRDAGPETLMVVVGSLDEVISDEELDWARGVCFGVMRRMLDRLPMIQNLIVTRFWALSMHSQNLDLPTPCFMAGQMDGHLTDRHDRTAQPPNARILLNAAVVQVNDEELT
ncbi:MAG: hypothetical protein ACON4U_11100 [Myxococcota bacterium]